MIGIKLEGESEFLETFTETSVDVTLENPLVDDAEDHVSPGSYSFPFNLPSGNASPKNSSRLKHTGVIENTQTFQLEKVDLFYAGVPFKSGHLKIKETKGNAVSAYFTFGINSVNPSIKTAKLRDVVSENAVISTTAITKKVYIKKLVNPTTDWNVTVNGTNYTGAPESVIIGINNAGELTVDTGKHVPFAVADAGVNSPKGFLSPDYIIISLCTYVLSFDEVLGWFPLPIASTDPLQELSISTDKPDDYLIEVFDMDPYYDAFDSFLATFPSDKLVFPVRFNANPYGASDKKTKISELVNGVDANGIIRNMGEGLNTKVINRNSLQPFVRLKYVLDKIATTFGFEWEGDFYTHAELPGFIIDNTFSLDSPQLWVEGETFVFWKRSFNLRDLVPDISVVELLGRLKLRYNLGLYYNEETKKVRMCFREPVAKQSTYEDITSYASKIETITDEHVIGYNISVPKEDSDDFSVVENLDIGTPEKDIVVKCGRIHQTGSTIISSELINGVRVSSKFGDKFGLRIFHFDGVINNGTFSYQACSISSAEFYEPLITSGVNIGLHDAFWKYWMHFVRSRRVVKLSITFPFRMLRFIDWELKRRVDRNNYLIKRIRFRLSNKGISTSDVELLTMK